MGLVCLPTALPLPPVRMCGYVLDCGDNCYQCYGFQMEPSSEKLCLALHRACRERFDRVLQVHPEARVVEEEMRKRQSVRQCVCVCACVCTCECVCVCVCMWHCVKQRAYCVAAWWHLCSNT